MTEQESGWVGSQACPWLPAYFPSLCLPCCSSVSPPMSSGSCQGVWIFWKSPLCLLPLPLSTPCPCRENRNVLLSALARRIQGFQDSYCLGEARGMAMESSGRFEIGAQDCFVGEQERRQNGDWDRLVGQVFWFGSFGGTCPDEEGELSNFHTAYSCMPFLALKQVGKPGLLVDLQTQEGNKVSGP